MMTERELIQSALMLPEPWMVKSCEFDSALGRLTIHLDFPRGSVFPCPECGEVAAAHDTEQKSWRHLNFFQHRAELTARVPRVGCPDCGVRLAKVPWARSGSGFTALFEAFCLTLARDMPVSKIAALVGEHDTRIWRVIRHHVDDARARADHSGVARIGIDETSSRRGHNYVSVFVDMDKSKVLFATEGKDASTVTAFKEDLKEHEGDPAKVVEVSMDMSKAFISGAGSEFPRAGITFDKFHCVKLMNEAVDAVRRSETKSRPELKGSRWVWLRNVHTMSPEQEAALDELSSPELNLRTARAYQIKLLFQDIFTLPIELAAPALSKWHAWASRCRLEPVVKFARTVWNHWEGILRWFDSGLTNGAVEAINGLIQTAKRRARGFRNINNFITMIYLICGKLDINVKLPT